MKLDKHVVFVIAEPVLGVKLIHDGFERYVRHWVVSGYSWDGDCMCSATHFKDVVVPIHSLRVTTNELRHALQKII